MVKTTKLENGNLRLEIRSHTPPEKPLARVWIFDDLSGDGTELEVLDYTEYSVPHITSMVQP